MAAFKRGGVWWYDFRAAGSRVRESSKARTKSEALQAEALRRSELLQASGAPHSAGKAISFTDFAYNEFAPWCANEHRDHPSTYARYMRSVKALAEFFGQKALDSINGGLVERYKLHRSQQPRKNAKRCRLVTAAAVNRDLAVLRIVFNLAVRLGSVPTNPVKGVRFLPENNLRMRVVTPEEEALYLKAAGPTLHDVAIVMLETGMRPSEVCRLQAGDVDFSLRSVHVRCGKTAYARRHIPLTQRAFAVLQDRTLKARGEWLFPCPYDVTKPVGEVRKAHDAAVRRAQIKPAFRLYDLRHTSLTRMAMSGIDLATLKELAGHSQIQMTMRYVHPTPEHKRRAILKFEGFLSRPTMLSGPVWLS